VTRNQMAASQIAVPTIKTAAMPALTHIRSAYHTRYDTKRHAESSLQKIYYH
jgi:hypothetical protein